MYQLVILWLVLVASFVAGHWRGYRVGRKAEREAWNRDYDIVVRREEGR